MVDTPGCIHGKYDMYMGESEKTWEEKKLVSRANSPIIDRMSKTLGANPIFHHQIWRANYFPRPPLRPYNPHSPLRDPRNKVEQN